MKYFITLALTFIHFTCSGQKIKMTLFDKQANKPVSFATIFNPINQTGTHSDEDGIFYIECQKNIKISHISYEDKFIDCNSTSDTLYLTSKNVILDVIEITSQRKRDKIKKNELIDAGVGNGRSKLHYAGIKEAALFIENPISRTCYIYEVFFSFNNVRFDGEKKLKGKDMMISIKLYGKSQYNFEPSNLLVEKQITERLQANSESLRLNLISHAIDFPSEGAFLAIEFLGYFEEDKFISLDINDVNTKNQFAPDLSGGHNKKYSFFRKTYSEQWDRVNIDIKGFFNFNFGLKLLSS
ncbi:MAG: carboxypeptidase-like regulatory domain-containing protein [Microscillaceae bacterium]|jgi:hypothetical protein|nr:carboxypeptidase-like regulatory domain-containing protein [Microscillaceae bacterium]